MDALTHPDTSLKLIFHCPCSPTLLVFSNSTSVFHPSGNKEGWVAALLTSVYSEQENGSDTGMDGGVRGDGVRRWLKPQCVNTLKHILLVFLSKTHIWMFFIIILSFFIISLYT